MASVSAPVRGAGGKVLAAISVSGPIERLTRSPGRLHAAAVVDGGRAHRRPAPRRLAPTTALIRQRRPASPPVAATPGSPVPGGSGGGVAGDHIAVCILMAALRDQARVHIRLGMVAECGKCGALACGVGAAGGGPGRRGRDLGQAKGCGGWSGRAGTGAASRGGGWLGTWRKDGCGVRGSGGGGGPGVVRVRVELLVGQVWVRRVFVCIGGDDLSQRQHWHQKAKIFTKRVKVSRILRSLVLPLSCLSVLASDTEALKQRGVPRMMSRECRRRVRV